ncbi:MAG TPA: endonuclease/exonuclease/phosphatase family protein [Elusimicrobiales bacterium]|nr:endonuclease/exonuclease/phosphatase family protein [Elusimicrobiales bacterium]
MRRGGLILSLLLVFCNAAAFAACSRSGFEIMSWNLQTFGHLKPERLAAVRKAYEAAVSSNVYAIAVQEIADNKGMETFLALLPGGTTQWAASFENSPDRQDNGIAYRKECSTVAAEGFLFRDAQGLPDQSKSLHPVRWARLKTGDLEYTLLSLHLTFQRGDASQSARELGFILDWTVSKMSAPVPERNFIIAGDFNLPTRKGKELSKRAKEKKWLPLEPLFKTNGAGALAVFVDEPTSRPHKQPYNNYDHFIVSPALAGSVAKAGRLPIEHVDKADHNSTAMVSDHYPVMLRLEFSTAAVAAAGSAQ